MPRKQRASWGCVQRIDRDRYRIRYWADLGDGYRRRTETVRGTRREADARLAALRTQHERQPGTPVTRPSAVTVGDVWRTWHAPDCEARLESGDLAPNTWRNAKAVWRRTVEPRWGAIRCDAVSALDVQEWVRGLKANEAKLAKMLLAQLIDKAVMYGICKTNPVRLRMTMPRESTELDHGVYTLEELGEVLRAVHGSPIEAAVILAAFGSARVGESLGVMRSEVRRRESLGVEVAVVPIVRQVGQSGLAVSDRLKNPQSRRVVAIPGPVGARLLELARQGDGDQWLTGSGVGVPIGRVIAGRLWRGAMGAAGLECHPLRNLRNSWETYMHWVMGVDPAMIERMMGHAGKTVTERHYDRPVEDMIVETVASAYAAHPFASTWDFLGHGANH